MSFGDAGCGDSLAVKEMPCTGRADHEKKECRALGVHRRSRGFTNCAKDRCAIRLIALEAQMGDTHCQECAPLVPK